MDVLLCTVGVISHDGRDCMVVSEGLVSLGSRRALAYLGGPRQALIN